MAPEMFLSEPYAVDRLMHSLGGTESGPRWSIPVHTDLLPGTVLCHDGETKVAPDLGLVISESGDIPSKALGYHDFPWLESRGLRQRDAEVPSFEVIRNIALTIFGKLCPYPIRSTGSGPSFSSNGRLRSRHNVSKHAADRIHGCSASLNRSSDLISAHLTSKEMKSRNAHTTHIIEIQCSRTVSKLSIHNGRLSRL